MMRQHPILSFRTSILKIAKLARLLWLVETYDRISISTSHTLAHFEQIIENSDLAPEEKEEAKSWLNSGAMKTWGPKVFGMLVGWLQKYSETGQ